MQLNMTNKDILIIEYGQYLTKESESKMRSFIFFNSNSSNEPRKDCNNNSYYYINEDYQK